MVKAEGGCKWINVFLTRWKNNLLESFPASIQLKSVMYFLRVDKSAFLGKGFERPLALKMVTDYLVFDTSDVRSLK